MSAPFFTEPLSLFSALLGPEPPVLIDVRRRELVERTARLIPASRCADCGDGAGLARHLERSRPVVAACAHGHNRSQRMTAFLRSEGFSASCLAGGYDAWVGAGLPTVKRSAGPVVLGEQSTIWVTRRRPRIDRVACPWLISRFLDPGARFLFVEPEQVLAVAQEEGAATYDVPGADFDHAGASCTFDALLSAFGLDTDPRLLELAKIVRGADTGRPDLSPQSAGLVAVAAGLSARFGDDDHGALKGGFLVYDALHAWLREACDERHHRDRSGQGRAA